MLLTRTAAVTILHRGPYSKPDDADPLVWGKTQLGYEGSPIEKLLVMDADGGIWDNLTLHPDVGDDAQRGSIVELTLEIRRAQVVSHNAAGREFVVNKDKFRVVDVVAASV